MKLDQMMGTNNKQLQFYAYIYRTDWLVVYVPSSSFWLLGIKWIHYNFSLSKHAVQKQAEEGEKCFWHKYDEGKTLSTIYLPTLCNLKSGNCTEEADSHVEN